MDRNNHPLCRTATQIIFACFLGYCVLAIVYVMGNNAAKSWLYRISLLVVTFLLCCAVITYIRPRGFPAIIVSTAMLGIVIVHGGFMTVEYLHPHGPWGIVAAAVAFSVWLFLAFRKAVNQYKRGRDSEVQ